MNVHVQICHADMCVCSVCLCTCVNFIGVHVSVCVLI